MDLRTPHALGNHRVLRPRHPSPSRSNATSTVARGSHHEQGARYRRSRLTVGADAGDGEQLPLARHSFELRAASLAKVDPGAGDEVLDRTGNDHLTGSSLGGHACPDVNRDPTHLAIELLALARVQTSANLEAKVAHRVDDRVSAADRSCWTIEGGEEPVAGGVELTAAEAGELPTHTRVVLREQLAPAAVAELGQLRRRADDVGEEHRRQHSLWLEELPLAAL